MAGLAFNLGATYVPLHEAALGAMAGYLGLWLVFWMFKLITGKEGMGYGDFKLLAALGAWMGWQALPLIVLFASFSGLAVSVALIVAGRLDQGALFPFGPHLAAAGGLPPFTPFIEKQKLTV